MSEELTALVLNCTLKASPEPSSADHLAQVVVDELEARGVAAMSIRPVDRNILPGVEREMGPGDEWPEILEEVLGAEILVFATPTWVGQHSSVAQRVIERLDAELAETDSVGRPVLLDRVAIPVVVGNEDGAHHIVGILAQALGDVGFTLPAQSGVYWNGEAMKKTDFRDLAAVPDAVAASAKSAASHAVHLSRLLRSSPYPTT